MQYDFKRIRELLTNGFTETELRQLPQDQTDFRALIHKFAQNDSKESIVSKIVTYAETKLKIEVLLDWAKDISPDRYEYHAPYHLGVKATSNPKLKTSIDPNFSTKLLDILLKIDALNNQDNRNMLLQNMPSGPVGAISRSSAPMADLSNIINAAKSWGRLQTTGELALVTLAKNALRFVEGTELGQRLEDLMGSEK